MFPLFTAAQITPDANKIVYVNKNASGNGSSWADATPELADALKAAQTNTNIKEIWVAKGAYKPLYRADNLSGANPADQKNSFVLVQDVKLYGGFDPENSRSDMASRNPQAAETILSGDIDGNNNLSNNAYHVVIAAGNVGTAELDGFTITGGNANENIGGVAIVNTDRYAPSYEGGGIYIDESSPKITRVIVHGNNARQGGGVSIYNSTSEISHVIIRNNTAQPYFGGGIAIGSAPTATINVRITNALIINNIAQDRGGGIYNGNYGSAEPELANVTISNNSAASGGGMYTLAGYVKISNSILWGNQKSGNAAVYGADIQNASSTGVTLRNSITQVYDTGNPADNNLTGSDPLFTNSGSGDYTLSGVSPAVNSGSNQLYWDAVSGGVPPSPPLRGATGGLDLAGNPRIHEYTSAGTIDMGAYENRAQAFVPDGNGIIYVRPNATGEGNGSGWDDATADLHSAIHAAGVQKVFVAIGNYNVGDHSFIMKNGVKIYGGFDPGNGVTALTHNRIVLDAGEGLPAKGSVLNGENTRPVIWNINNGLTASAVLDGFTIMNGKYTENSGGGIRNVGVSPVLSNLVIKNNTAARGAGIYNESGSPAITNVIISGNTASSATYAFGGGIANVTGNPAMTNVRITDNTVTGNNLVAGGAIYSSTSGPLVLTNLTVARNKATGGSTLYGSGIVSENAQLIVYNSIVWGNEKGGSAAVGGADIDIPSGTVVLKNSITQGYTTGNPADHNLVGADPLFVDAANRNYMLSNNSPAINAGENSYFTGLDANTRDLAGNARLKGTAIDPGAYENIIGPDADGIIYVNTEASGKGSGDSWLNAMADLHLAIHVAGVKKVFVAAGNYNVGAHSFVMKNGVEIYGGFAPGSGITDLAHARIMPDASGPSSARGSILNGQGVRPVIWNVFTEGSPLDNTAVLDGFTITGGAGSAGPPAEGGGFYNVYASPVLTNLVVRGNAATSGGGMLNVSSSPLISNSVFSGNVCYYAGGAICNRYSNPVLTNVTIAHNRGEGDDQLGTGIFNEFSSPGIYNSIFWGNVSFGSTNSARADIFNSGSTVTLKNSITQRYDTGNSVDNNLTGVDPLFTDEATRDYTLSSNSPAIGTGNNAYFTGLDVNTKDLAGNARLSGTAIDIGAYEFGSVLPVRWISFAGNIGEGSLAALQWKAEETNTRHYELERSSDARVFRRVAEIPAAGQGIAAYRFTDPLPVSGTAYYRIRQVDLDGSFSFSRIIGIHATAIATLKAYPNPARGPVTIEFDDVHAGSQVNLVTPAGTLLQRITIKERVFTISLDGYPAGIYLLRTSDGKTVKLLKE